MTHQNILYIEASKADYKEQLEEKKPRSWLKSVSAFANTHGGHLIFGVKNEPRTVAGLADPQAVISKATELIKARIDPAPRYMVQVIEIEGKVCVDLEVQNGPAYPYYYAADGVRVAYGRAGDPAGGGAARAPPACAGVGRWASAGGAAGRPRRNIRFEGVESVEVHGLSSLELSLRATNDTRRNLRLREADFGLYWGGNCVARVVLMEEVTLPRRTTGCIATRWRVRVDDPLTFYVAARRIGRGDVDRATVSWHVRGRYGVASANLSQEKVPLSDFLRNFGLSVDDLIKLF